MSDRLLSSEAIAQAAATWVARRDAGLTTSERAEFDRWCAADQRHRAALAHYSAAWGVLDRPGQSGAIRRELRKRIRRRRGYIVTAAVALCLAVTTFWRFAPPRLDGPSTVAAPGGRWFAPEQRTLPDGSIVELKSGAEIAVDFSATLRRVTLLRGEAHFQVAKNGEWPFAVDAGGVQVRAVGTAFSVDRDSARVEVVVTEGRIAVKRPANSAPDGHSAGLEPFAGGAEWETLAIADAGQQVVLAVANERQKAAVTTVPAEELAERLSWRAPRVEFSSTPLAEAVALINRSVRERKGDVQLVIEATSAGLAREPISGIFRADNAETFVRMLELSLGIQTERQGNQIVLRKSG